MRQFFQPRVRKGVNILLLCLLVFGWNTLTGKITFHAGQNENRTLSQVEKQKKYPESWNIPIVPGSKLENLAKTYDQKIALLPPGDLDDRAPLPGWFRAFLRKKLVGLPTKGRPQYPPDAGELLLWLKSNQGFSQNELNSRLEKLRKKVQAVKAENKRRTMYLAEWEVDVSAGTKLDTLRKRLDAEFSLLPEKDIEDTTPLPIWFRVYLRKQFPKLPKSGPYQYPRTAGRILQRMLGNPDAIEINDKQD
ncbi:hypothetical protein ACFLRB_02540 [Acidobacteriota bacterium]